MSEGEKGENKKGVKFSLYMYTVIFHVHLLLCLAWFEFHGHSSHRIG